MSPNDDTLTSSDGVSSVRISAPELWRFSFVRNELQEDISIDSPPPIVFGLALNRYARNRIGVELSVELSDFPPVAALVAYRAVFEIDEVGSNEDIERDLRFVATQVAPAALYPFVRETVLTASAKAGMPPVLAPIVNFQSVFKPDELTLPPAPAEQAKAK